MNPDNFQETMKRIDALAEKLGTTSEYIWAVLIKQARVQVGIECFEILLCVVGIAVSAIFIHAGRKMYKQEMYEEAEMGIFVFLAGLVSLFAFFAALAGNITQPLIPLLNPEYWALEQILKVAK